MMNPRQELNYGGKIILPPSALDILSNLNIEYPMIFELSSSQNNTHTHAGVLEFIAEEGRIYLPNWMMKVLGIQQNDVLSVSTTNLPKGKLVKLQAQSVDFLDITDPKAVLEKAFRSFSVLTRGDIFTFEYNKSLYDMLVMEVKPDTPKGGISILDTDLEVDFAAPLGYVEPQYTNVAEERVKAALMGSTHSIEEHVKKEESGFKAYEGKGQSLKGRTSMTDLTSQENQGPPPALNLPPGRLFFGYPVKPLKVKGADGEASKPKFTGDGVSLRQAKKPK